MLQICYAVSLTPDFHSGLRLLDPTVYTGSKGSQSLALLNHLQNCHANWDYLRW